MIMIFILTRKMMTWLLACDRQCMGSQKQCKEQNIFVHPWAVLLKKKFTKSLSFVSEYQKDKLPPTGLKKGKK